MTRVIIFKNKDNHITGYNISGHSGYDIKGQDIVCAAISVLAQTALMSLIEVCGINENIIEYFIDEQEGILNVDISGSMDMNIEDKSEIVLKTLEIGIKSIEKSYPEFVTLEYEEV